MSCSKHSSLLLATTLVVGCETRVLVPANAGAAVETVAAIAAATYEDAHLRSVALRDAVDALVGSPSATTLADARARWIEARIPYLQSETLRGSDGPIELVEGEINAWPLDEAHVDYVVDGAGITLETGLVNDTSFVIATSSVVGANENPGENDVSLGYHAIEFLLWGQDRSTTGPGDRPHTDYVTGPAAVAPNPERRGLYLQTITQRLVADLDGVRAQWAPGSTTNYRHDFTASMTPEQALRRVFESLYWYSNSELGGDRLSALITGDQEDEHSCFSDTTRTDFVEDARGVQNLYLGTYTRIDGTVVSGVGLYDVVHAVDPVIADQLRERIATSLALAVAFHDPYDQEIAPSNVAGRARVQAFYASMGLQTSLILAAAEKLGLTPLGGTP